jgi:PAS domain S-box-containing protein
LQYSCLGGALQLRYIASIPIAALIIAILLTLFFGFSDNYYFNPPNFVFATNLIFWSIAIISVAYISAKSFLKEGSAIVLIISCSIIVLGLSLIISGWVTNFSGNYSVAIANIAILTASALQVLCGILSLTGNIVSKIGHNIKTLTSIYIAAVVFVLAISALALLGYLPTFYTASGPTLIRQIVLGSGILFFAIACILFIGQYLKSKASSLYWYALAIGLFSISLSSTFEIKMLGDVPTWLGRIGLYIGAIFLLAAILSTKKKADSTDRASAWAEAFKSNPEQFAALFNSMLDAFIYCKILVDKNGHPIDWIFLDVNDAYGRIAGLKKEQIVGKKVSELFPDERNDPLDWINRYGHVALTGESTHFDGYSQSLKKWIHVSSYSPKKGYFISLFDDITERKIAEEAIKQSEEKYHQLFTSMTEMFQVIELIYDENGKAMDYYYREVNPAFEKLVGKTREQLIDKRAKDLFGIVEDYWIEQYDNVNKFGSPVHLENYGAELDKWYEIYAWKADEKQVAITFTDVTERKKATEALKEYQKNLEKLVEERTKQLKDAERLAAIGATAGMVGHDIRNPLQAITGDLFLAKTELASTPDSEEKNNIQESLTEIEKNIDYINKIVQDLQDFARPLNPNAGEADLKLIIEKILQKNGISENITLKVKVEDEARKVVADSDYLNRILFNLVTNAVQAMPKGGKLTISVRKEENNVIIRVKDTGVGIPESAKSKLFTPMFTTKSKGQGFGLAVVKRMTESLGGTVTFESQEGKGTTFTVRLPTPPVAKR